MRTVSRALVAGSLSVPLLFGGAGAAMASDYDSGHASGKGYATSWQKYSGWKDWYPAGDQSQTQSNSTQQSNEANTSVYQVSVGNKGDTTQNAYVNTEQSNSNDTEQSQTQK